MRSTFAIATASAACTHSPSGSTQKSSVRRKEEEDHYNDNKKEERNHFRGKWPCKGGIPMRKEPKLGDISHRGVYVAHLSKSRRLYPQTIYCKTASSFLSSLSDFSLARPIMYLRICAAHEAFRIHFPYYLPSFLSPSLVHSPEIAPKLSPARRLSPFPSQPLSLQV